MTDVMKGILFFHVLILCGGLVWAGSTKHFLLQRNRYIVLGLIFAYWATVRLWKQSTDLSLNRLFMEFGSGISQIGRNEWMAAAHSGLTMSTIFLYQAGLLLIAGACIYAFRNPLVFSHKLTTRYMGVTRTLYVDTMSVRANKMFFWEKTPDGNFRRVFLTPENTTEHHIDGTKVTPLSDPDTSKVTTGQSDALKPIGSITVVDLAAHQQQHRLN